MIARTLSALVLALGFATAAAAAEPAAPPALKVDILQTPVKTMQIYRDTWVPNPDGKGWTRLLFYHYYRAKAPCQTVAINTETGDVKKFMLPDKAPSGAPWRWCVGHDGKCYMGHYGSASIWIYDPAANELDFVNSGIKDVGTVSAIACGTDGKIYCSTTPKIITFQYDPAAGKFTNCGIQGPKRDYLGYGYTVAADDEYVYTAAGKIPWMCVAYNKETSKQTILFQGDQLDYVAVSQQRYGCTALHMINVGPDKGQRRNYWLYQGQAILQKPGDKPPWPEPKEKPAVPLPPKPREILDQAVPGSDGHAVYWWQPAAVKGPDGKVQPTTWRSVKYDLEVCPVDISFLHEMPDGRLLGCGTAYQDWFIVDPKDDSVQVLGKIPLSHYATVFAGGKAYMMGYPSTPLFEYDPAKPWTVGSGTPEEPAPPIASAKSNARLLHRFGDIIKTHHARAGAVGVDGRIYIGAHAERSCVGGGLAWWDPKTEKFGGLREPFELYDIAGLCAIDDGKRIVYSSRLVTEPGTRRRADSAQLFVFDPATEKLDGFAPFPKAASTGRILAAGGSVVVGVLPGAPAKLYRADVDKGTVLQTVDLPAAVGDFRLGPDGRIWCFADKTLLRIDPSDLAVEQLGTVPAAGHVAFAGKDIYLSGQPELRVIRNAVK